MTTVDPLLMTACAAPRILDPARAASVARRTKGCRA